MPQLWPSPLRLLVATIAATLLSVKSYDQDMGLQLAYLEKAVYCGEARFQGWDVGDSISKAPKVDPWKLRYVKSELTDAVAGVGRLTTPPACFVAMRGTVGTVSTMMDAMFWLTEFPRKTCPGCLVDFGFYNSYDSISAEIFQALNLFGCQTLPLELVGHSMGSAELTYFLFDVLDMGFKVNHAYAMESTRPGNEVFANTLSAKVTAAGVDAWRISHYKDLIVHLPPAAVLSYTHALPEIYYTSRNGLDYKQCAPEDDSCSNQWWQPWELTADDHMWYANVNPCWCQNDTKAVAWPLMV